MLGRAAISGFSASMVPIMFASADAAVLGVARGNGIRCPGTRLTGRDWGIKKKRGSGLVRRLNRSWIQRRSSYTCAFVGAQQIE